MSILFDLFLVFAKIGLFTFGGGYAMISVIEDNCVSRKKWITGEEMMNITVIAESTPGPVAINCATFVGYKQKGVAGALAATFGMVLPSFIIIFVISLFLNNLLEFTVVASAFKGIKLAVGLLILDAGIKLLKTMKKNKLSVIIMVCSLALMMLINIFSWNFSSIYMLLIAALIGFITFGIQKANESKRGNSK